MTSETTHALLAFSLALVLAACGSGTAERQAAPARNASSVPDVPAPAYDVLDEPADSITVEQRFAWAREQRLDTLAIGDIVARIGRTFVGGPYVPGTLEVPGAERLVVNLREFDCVTLVETTLALARSVRAGKDTYGDFKDELVRIRYRAGTLDGYASRLHYFSEWIADNGADGILRDVTEELGGVPDTEPISFMTAHRASYRQLSDDSVFARIRSIEERLSTQPRIMIPKERIDAVVDRIRDGDIIAATTNIAGLDIAHTGIAFHVAGRLHLMHAPLVGTVVEISPLPLAERIQKIRTQDGITVARPL
jgi:hypothetical protein